MVYESCSTSFSNFILKIANSTDTSRATTFKKPFAAIYDAILPLNQITAFTLADGLVNLASNWVKPNSGGGLVNPAYDPD